MPPIEYHGHVFARQPMAYNWRRGLHDLGGFITDAMRAEAAQLTANEWVLDRVLDQGATPHCVGFAWATWGNTLPVDDDYLDADGHKIYYEAVALGGYPNTEDGAQTEWGAKAMVARTRAQGFAWASSIDDMITWLLVRGPLVTGLVWTQGMADPDSLGIMHAQGSQIGGHETCWTGVDKNMGRFTVANSWGTAWAHNGRAFLSLDDMAKVLANQGDCCTAVELPLAPAPAPVPNGCARFAQALAIAQRKLQASRGAQTNAEVAALQLAIDYLRKGK